MERRRDLPSTADYKRTRPGSRRSTSIGSFTMERMAGLRPAVAVKSGNMGSVSWALQSQLVG